MTLINHDILLDRVREILGLKEQFLPEKFGVPQGSVQGHCFFSLLTLGTINLVLAFTALLMTHCLYVDARHQLDKIDKLLLPYQSKWH